MSTGETTQEKYYPSKELCSRLDISDSTLRKWCIGLEKQEYGFTRTDQNRRLFVERDLEVLDHLKVLIQDKKMSLENASIIVASRFSDSRSSTGTPSVPSLKTGMGPEVFEQLIEHIQKQDERSEKQEQYQEELLKRLDQQNEYIIKRLDQQDANLARRDQSFTENMNQLMEKRKEEIKLLEQATDKKPSWFAKIFKKKG